VKDLDYRTHGRHYQPADEPDQGRKDDETGFVCTNECPQPLRSLEIMQLVGHFQSVRRQPETRAVRLDLAGFGSVAQSGRIRHNFV
jgi:hypothetical protein